MAIMKDPPQCTNVAPRALTDRVAGAEVQKKERKREGAQTGMDLAIWRPAERKNSEGVI